MGSRNVLRMAAWVILALGLAVMLCVPAQAQDSHTRADHVSPEGHDHKSCIQGTIQPTQAAVDDMVLHEPDAGQDDRGSDDQEPDQEAPVGGFNEGGKYAESNHIPEKVAP